MKNARKIINKLLCRPQEPTTSAAPPSAPTTTTIATIIVLSTQEDKRCRLTEVFRLRRSFFFFLKKLFHAQHFVSTLCNAMAILLHDVCTRVRIHQHKVVYVLLPCYHINVYLLQIFEI